MVDYFKGTGGRATMKIVDLGLQVEFWINSGDTTTFHHSLPWGYTVDGSTNNYMTYDYPANGGWRRLGWWNVRSNQTVRFALGSTGLFAFGGPTVFEQAITRSTAPAPPVPVTFSNITSTSVQTNFVDGPDGGSPITGRRIARNTVNSVSGASIFGGEPVTHTGLTPGGTYYFWGSTQNVNGWSSWGDVRSIKLPTLPGVPDSPIVSDIKQTTVRVTFVDPVNDGGMPIIERQVIISTTTNPADGAPVNYNVGGLTLTNLFPAFTYYLWSRVRTSVGWSSYSTMKPFRSIGGAWVNVGGVWKDAVPFVRVGGVWKVATPFTKTMGEWKENI